MSKHTQIKLPTPTEDAAITAAAQQDSDAQLLTDAELAQFMHEHERQQFFAKAKTVETTITPWNDFNAQHGSFANEHSTL